MNTERAHVGWGFWLWWVLASTVGWVLGGEVGVLSVWIVGLVGIVVGLGIAQWLVLRQHLSRAGWWVLASTVGWVVGLVVGGSVNLVVGGAVNLFVVVGLVGIGFGIGIAQWLVLRPHLSRAGWWVLASTVGLAVGGAVGVAVGGAVGIAVGGSISLASILSLVVGFPVSGAVYGAITGGAMVWLLRQPKLEE